MYINVVTIIKLCHNVVPKYPFSLKELPTM